MQTFTRKSVIPTHSEASGIQLSNKLYFSSHTNIFSVENNRFSLFSSVEGTVTCFSIRGNRALICTENRVFLNYGESEIGSLKREASAIDSDEFVFAIGTGTALEVWEVPVEYKFPLFKRVFKGTGHSKAIRRIKILDSKRILTASEDGTVRIFDWKLNSSRILMKTRGTPVGIHTVGDKIAVTSEDGRVCFFEPDREAMDEVQVDIQGPIVCSSHSANVLAVVAKPEDARSILILFENELEIRRVNLESKVTEIDIQQHLIAMRGPEFVGVYSVGAELFTFTIDLPKITSFSAPNKNLIVTCCRDNRVRIYSNHACQSVLVDPSTTGDILDVHTAKGSCVVSYKNGHVSVFNMEHGTCYRSFTVSSDVVDYAHSCISEDATILFLGRSSSIFMIDLQRSKLLDELKCESSITALKFYRNRLYIIDLSSHLSCVNPFTGASDVLTLEHIPTALAVNSSVVAVSIQNEVNIYDLNLNFIRSMSVSLDARSRDEIYSKSKPVETIGINSSMLVCGGRSNQIKIVSYKKSENSDSWTNETLQILQLSKHSDWENYKARLGREKDTAFNKQNVVEARKIEASDGRFLVLSREGISIYEPRTESFNPIEFRTEANPKFIKDSLESGDVTAALIAALQLGDYQMIKEAILTIASPRVTVRQIPARYLPLLLESSVSVLREDFERLNVAEMIKWIVVEGGVADSSHADILKHGMHRDYSLVRDVLYMLRCLEKK